MRLPPRAVCRAVCWGFSSSFLCILFLLKYVFLLVLKSFLSPLGARSHPRCQDLLPEGPNLHEVITKRANLSTLPRGNEVGVE